MKRRKTEPDETSLHVGTLPLTLEIIALPATPHIINVVLTMGERDPKRGRPSKPIRFPLKHTLKRRRKK